MNGSKLIIPFSKHPNDKVSLMTNTAVYSWIFMSIFETPATLKDIIAMADAINHAIPTHSELQKSLAWLQERNLVVKHENKYSLSKDGATIRQENSAKTIMETWKKIEKVFTSLPIEIAITEDISEADVSKACEKYSKEFWEIAKKNKYV